MRIYVPGPSPLTTRDHVRRVVDFSCRVGLVAVAGFAVIVIGCSSGAALGVWSIKLVEIAGGF